MPFDSTCEMLSNKLWNVARRMAPNAEEKKKRFPYHPHSCVAVALSGLGLISLLFISLALPDDSSTVPESDTLVDTPFEVFTHRERERYLSGGTRILSAGLSHLPPRLADLSWVVRVSFGFAWLSLVLSISESNRDSSEQLIIVQLGFLDSF